MTSTDDLIRSLAGAAGARRNASLQTVFAVTVAASLAGALILVYAVVGIRPDFAQMAVRLPFAFKLAYTGSLAAGMLAVALSAARPGASANALYALLPAAVLLVLGALFDPTGFPLTGRSSTSIAHCMRTILLLSLPGLVLTFAAMRKGAPTQPLLAGAVIGMLSASIGALAYTLACKNDGTAFVAAWYTAACALVALMGAVVGSRVLRW